MTQLPDAPAPPNAPPPPVHDDDVDDEPNEELALLRTPAARPAGSKRRNQRSTFEPRPNASR